ncbi:hypothetical protein JMJ35_008475 [Cladonia borealis]|uniref:Exoribonuclease phosphorolytic domain-containing protein n=1 Tax=Cladonia borealis TaxID=184061 RepID=A0AA39QWA3_9LECA|nr:hypothetical protein JMJ35_008475 [Cladonia borealis]
MPLPPSIYHLSSSHLRLDGRRWNELRRLTAQISTQASADGSSYLEMGNTKVLCTVTGPSEGKGGGRRGDEDSMSVDVRVNVAGFAGMDRKRVGRGDRRITELQNTISSAFSSTLFTHLYPHSTISLQIHILSLDGSLLAASLNAATLALIDAGVPMRDYLVACTAGLTPPSGRGDGDDMDPLLDLNGSEETEVPFLTVGTGGAGGGDVGGGGGWV